MPVKIKIDLNFGDIIYIKNDYEQLPHVLVGIKIVPQNQVKFIISFFGEKSELYDFECSTERNELLYLESDSKDEDD